MPSRSEPSTRSRRTIAPVAISAFPKRTSSLFESRATRSPVSSFITLVRVSTSTSPPVSSGTASPPRRYSLDSGGRSYGASASRPTTRIEPAPPSCRSVRAQLVEAGPPPISRKSTSRPANELGGLRLPAAGLEHGGDLLLEPGVEHKEHLVALFDHRVRERHEPRAVAQDRDEERPRGNPEGAHLLACGRRAPPHLQLDDLEPLLRQVQQV